MSIAVAVLKGKDVVLAADSQISFGSMKIDPDNHKVSKIRKIGNVFMASTGWALYDNIFDDYLSHKKTVLLSNQKTIFTFFMQFWIALRKKYTFVNDQCDKDEDSPFGDLDSSFLIINQNGIFYIGSDMSITRFDKYFAIGSGSDYSLGALHALYDLDYDADFLARKSVEAGIAFNSRCGGAVEIQKLKLK